MKHIFLTISFLILTIVSFSQEVSHKYLFVKFDSYSVEVDKLLQSQLSQEKIVYTCIPSGILVFEVPSTDTISQARISGELKKIISLPAFLFIQNMSIQEAEDSCSAYRKPD